MLCLQHVLLYVPDFLLKRGMLLSKLLTQLCTHLGHLLVCRCNLLTQLIHSYLYHIASLMHVLYGFLYLGLTVVGYYNVVAILGHYLV